MDRHVGGPQASQAEGIDESGGAVWQRDAEEDNRSGSKMSPLMAVRAYEPSTKETCVAPTTASSSPVALSPFPVVDTALSLCVLHGFKGTQGELSADSCIPSDGAVAAPLPSVVAAVGVSDVLSEPSNDTAQDAVAPAVATLAAETTANSPASADGYSAVLLSTSSYLVVRAWNTAKATAAAAASAAVFTNVAAADLFARTEASAASVLALAGNIGLGSRKGDSGVKSNGTDTERSPPNVDTASADSVRASESARAAPDDTAADVSTRNSSNGGVGVSRLVGHLSMPALSQWFHSPTRRPNVPLGCTAAVVDIDTELQGAAAESAAAAHMATVSAASAAAACGLAAKVQPKCSYSEEQGFEPVPGTPKASAIALEAGLADATTTALSAADTDAAATGNATHLGGPRTPNADFTSALNQYLADGDEAQLSQSSTDTPGIWDRSLSSETTEKLLELLQENAGHTASLSSCSSSANAADISHTCTNSAKPGSHDSQNLLLQQQLIQLKGTTDAVVTSERVVQMLQRDLGLKHGSSEATAASVACAERALQHQKQTVWASLLVSLTESSRRSVEAVQRAATTAVSTVGAIGNVPLFGACRTLPTHIHEVDEHLPQGGVPSERGGEGEATPKHLQGATNGDGQLRPISELANTEEAPLGLMLELKRRQHAILEELRNRSINLLEHSVALTTSSSLSEARYHLAEIVDTGGPEVSGVWAGFKVGLGIVTLASGHLLLGGAMVAVATGSLGSAIMWSHHRQQFYEIMCGTFRGSEEQSEAPEDPGANDTTDESLGLLDVDDGSKGSG